MIGATGTPTGSAVGAASGVTDYLTAETDMAGAAVVTGVLATAVIWVVPV